jgi:hypothetical protein
MSQNSCTKRTPMHLLSLNTNIITEVICDIPGDKSACQKNHTKIVLILSRNMKMYS